MAKTEPKKEESKMLKVEKISYATEDINKVLNYLGSRPFNEVLVLIQILQSGEVEK